MPGVEQQVAAVKADIATAQGARARAEHEYQVARAQAEAAARELQGEFGVSSVQQARELISTFEAQLEAECSAVREALDRSGRGSS